jgi:hypothetical protein
MRNRHPPIVAVRFGMLFVTLLYSASAWAQTPAPAPAAPAEPPALEADPAVRTALDLPRETPADYLQAIVWLIDLGRPELAKPILDELAKLQLTEDQRSALVAEFGSRDMLRLARAKELAPAGAEFADACMAAAAAQANDPERIDALVKQVTDPAPEIRQMAARDLAATGQGGVVATLEALAKATSGNQRAALVAAAAEMHPLVVGPLLAMLDTQDAALRADATALLDRLRVPQAVPLLVEDPAQRQHALREAIERFQQGTPPFPADEANRVALWRWDDASNTLSSERFAAPEARIIWLSRLANELAELRPEDSGDRRRAVVLGLEAAHYLPASRRSPAIGQLAAADVPSINAVLADALRADYAHAAVAAIDALAKRGDPGALLLRTAQPSPLATALGHGDRRVRFAALRTIMALDPPSPYPGSSRVPDALAWFAGSSGGRQALVAMPTLAASTNLAGMVAAHDLEAQATNRGRDAVDLARDMADLEMIFVDVDILAPGIRQVVYELRLSPVTRNIPVALLAADGRLDAAERLAAEHDRVIAVPRAHSDDVLSRYIARLQTLAGRDPVSPDERASQAADARAWLDQLARTRPFYTIRRAMPTDRRGHAEAAANMATPSSGHATQP